MKNRNYLLLFGLILSIGLLTTSCQKDDDDEPTPDPCAAITCLNDGFCASGTCHCPEGFSGVNCEIEDPCHQANINNEWGYDGFGGPECWSGCCSSNGTCGAGTAQSPINIVNAVDITTLPDLSITSNASTKTEITNNGHTLEFGQEPGSFLTYGQTSNGFFNDFTLGQFHFHANSEHQVDGSYAPLEAHFVCRSIWANEYIVVSVLFTEGATNPFLAQFVNNLPSTENDTFEDDDLTYNPFDLLPANRSYYRYQGSLTTPPCSEVVTWIIMENKVEATAAEIAAFSNILDSNFRPIQDLNGRTINHVAL